MINKLVILIILYNSWALASHQCESLFSLNLINQSLKEQNSEVSPESVVFYSKQQEPDFIVLDKNINTPWISMHRSRDTDLSREGDVRNPMFTFGPELSEKMGFEIKQIGPNHLRIKIPNAKRIARFVKAINIELRKAGKEEIAYLPVRFGYATDHELIKISVSGRGSYDMLFPFSDFDPTLVSHEIAYHLGLIVFPQKILERVRVVTERHLQFIQFLKEKGGFLGLRKDDFINQIELDRAFDLDFGSGNAALTLAELKKENPGKTYRDFSRTQLELFDSELNYLVRSQWIPVDVVVARVQNMISNLGFANFPMHQTVLGHGAKFRLTDYQTQKMIQLLKEFSSRYEQTDYQNYPTIDAKSISSSILSHLDQRIQDINEAAKHAGF